MSDKGEDTKTEGEPAAEAEAAEAVPEAGEDAPAEEEHQSHNETEEEADEAEDAGPVEADDASKKDGAACDHMPIGERIEKDPLELKILRKLPNFPEFLTIPKINTSRTVWRTGMRKLEEIFAEHIANMHLDFENKAL